MTLQGSGQISFNDLRVEMGISGQAPFSITSASTGLYATINATSPGGFPNSTAPHSLSEWYSYTHCNSLGTFEYDTGTPGTPSTCDGTQYPSTGNFYSQACTVFADGCVLYTNSSCTTTALSAGVAYMHDGGSYYTINGSSAATFAGSCSA